ncbi:MAG TPA: NAD-dependent epimerase/dehydratase family protein [Actinomycetota bacterium]|nr:NAD-dependent epimerase/dehydratase family protein [Actinomycetota bacterium]
MTTALVTGAAGFIGSHLCDRLLGEGRRVVGVDDLSTGRLANLVEARAYGSRFTFYNVDVLAEGLPGLFERHRPEVVFHLAAPRASPFELEAVRHARAGVLGLLSVLEAAARAGARKVVFASSAAVYGEPRRLPVREAALAGARPTTAAAVSKRAAEDYLRFYQRHRGLDFVSVVLPTVYGPRQDPSGGVVGALASAMLEGVAPAVAGDGAQTRDFLFVDDAVHALALAADRGHGLTVNVGTGVETSIRELFDLLARVTGYRGAPKPAPPPPGDLRRMALDATLARRELGWKPWTHLEDGLRETVAYLRGT